MPSDTEPRYRLVDSNGNVVGSLYAEADGTLKIQEGTSGSDNEVSIATDGTFSAPAVSTGTLANNNSDISVDDALNLTASIRLNGNRLTGLRQVGGAAPADLDQQEMVLDPSNTRIVWKDGSGTTFYWTSDGTL